MTDYPWEDQFREWAEKNNAFVIDNKERGNALVAEWGDEREVWLYENGSVVIRAIRHLGGCEEGDDVRIEGSRLVIEERDGSENRVSNREFPVLR